MNYLDAKFSFVEHKTETAAECIMNEANHKLLWNFTWQDIAGEHSKNFKSVERKSGTTIKTEFSLQNKF